MFTSHLQTGSGLYFYAVSNLGKCFLCEFLYKVYPLDQVHPGTL